MRVEIDHVRRLWAVRLGAFAAVCATMLCAAQPAPAAEHESVTVSSFSPTEGPEAGGTVVTVIGQELEHVTSVTFGGKPAASVTIDSPTELQAVTPPGTYRVNLRLTEDLGNTVTAGEFEYVASPGLIKVKPNKGPATGGTTVVIEGVFLQKASEVRFGSEQATIVSDTYNRLTVISPPNAAETVGIVIVTPGGTVGGGAKAEFKYSGVAVTAVTPDEGPWNTRPTVTVTGSGFALGSATRFEFGSLGATDVDCTSTTECTMLAPGGTKPRVVDVRAVLASKKSKKTPADRYAYT